MHATVYWHISLWGCHQCKNWIKNIRTILESIVFVAGCFHFQPRLIFRIKICFNVHLVHKSISTYVDTVISLIVHPCIITFFVRYSHHYFTMVVGSYHRF